ncbi:MAG: NAD-dependent epimerase/dehydratase family protein [Alcanivoracaceae bacterium]|jgi:nucleoside-diphosphate-sugar epimerase|nr:NAD-dependent epimerase/dehydratase family protein [Alcanivoracaceae bacterium]
MKISRALVTGANGFIGGNLCRHLAAAQIPVRALVLPGEDVTALQQQGIDIVWGDITAELPAHLFDDVSHIFHLAAVAFDWGDWPLFWKVNALGTERLLRAAVSAGVPRFIHMSSLAVHAYTGHVDSDESAPTDSVINHYAVSKRLAEEAVTKMAAEIHVTIIRPGMVPYGPGDRLTIPGMVDALRRGIYAHVDGGRRRVCLVQVDNLADGMLLAAQRNGASGEAYVLADQVVSWREFADALADAFLLPRAKYSVPLWLVSALAMVLESLYRALPLKGAPVLTRYRASLFKGDLVFSSAKARRDLGWQPQVTLQEGLSKIYASSGSCSSKS